MPEENWKQVWERVGNSESAKRARTTVELFAADGFDSPLGKTSEESWRHLSETIRSYLKLDKDHKLLEVGCGAGAVLSLLQDACTQLSGFDYSTPHIEIARRALPHAEFRTGEACEIPFESLQFERVLSHGVFLYFPNLSYAETALKEMLRVSTSDSKILVMDIPDAAKREAALAARRAAGASLTPGQLYYPKSFFEDFASAHRLRATVFDQCTPGYANAPFRFNALLEH